MAIHRGIQSALFYYLSCAPCTEARTRRKRRKEADLLRSEKESLARTDPANGLDQYRHPLPSTTNPAWDLEIALGPSKQSKAASRQNKSKAKETPPRSSGSTSKSDRKDSKLRSTPDFSLNERARLAEGFQRHRRPHQDHDILLGRAESGLSQIKEPTDPDIRRPKPVHHSAKTTPDPLTSPATDHVHAPPPIRLASVSISSPSWPYQPHPPVNDLHPATVTRYDTPDDIAWMLAPPPSAKIMRGQEPELPHHLPPPRRTPTLSSNNTTRPTHFSPLVSAYVPADRDNMAGLGIDFDTDADDEDDDEDERSVFQGASSADGQIMEKRDSAGPQPGRDGGGNYLFPPRDWDRERRDSGSEEGWGPGKAERGRPVSRRRARAREREVRWRWSIDW